MSQPNPIEQNQTYTHRRLEGVVLVLSSCFQRHTKSIRQSQGVGLGVDMNKLLRQMSTLSN
jgi:hypothetical protein